MPAEMEYWTAALDAEREHGDRAPVYIAERVGAAALDGDEAGIAFWKNVASCWMALQDVKDENGDYPDPTRPNEN